MDDLASMAKSETQQKKIKCVLILGILIEIKHLKKSSRHSNDFWFPYMIEMKVSCLITQQEFLISHEPRGLALAIHTSAAVFQCCYLYLYVKAILFWTVNWWWKRPFGKKLIYSLRLNIFKTSSKRFMLCIFSCRWPESLSGNMSNIHRLDCSPQCALYWCECLFRPFRTCLHRWLNTS